MSLEVTEKPCYARVVTGSVHDEIMVDNVIDFEGNNIVVGTDNDCAGAGECILGPTSFDFMGGANSALGSEFIAHIPGLAPYLDPLVNYGVQMYPEDGTPCDEINDYLGEPE